MLGSIRAIAGGAVGFVGPSQRRHTLPPPAVAPNGPPPRELLTGEVLAAAQLPRLLLAAPRLLAVPRGDGGPIVDIPGWRAPEASMAPIRAYLRWLGHDARTWGFGTNLGDVEGDVERMSESVAALARDRGRPVGLVGWSLGGVIAREVSRRLPDEVDRVVTFGTPVVGGPSHTAVARSYEPGAGERVDRIVEELNASQPIGAPITAIFTRRDGVVAWQACIDRTTEGAEHVEVGSTHLGLGIDPDVWEVVGRALA